MKLFRKSLAIGIIFLLVGAGVVPSISSETSSSGDTIYVDDDNTEGPWDGTQEYPYQHIQDGINNSENGDIINVYNGTYYENLIVNVTVELIGLSEDLFGSDVGGAIIDGTNNGDVVKITIAGVQIGGFTIQYSGNVNAGIQIESTSNNIFKNIVRWNGYGVVCSGVNRISNNNITDNIKDGVQLTSPGSVILSGNNITNNQENGISLKESSQNIISSNYIFENRGNGIDLYQYSTQNEVYDNIILNNTGDGVNIWWGSKNNNFTRNNVTSNKEDGFHIDFSSSVGESEIRVENNDILNNSRYGIYIFHSREDTISLNEIHGNGDDGLYLECSNYTIISGNNVTDNDEGLYQISSTGNTISDNTFMHNDEGIYLISSINTKILTNTIRNNTRGIYLASTTDSKIVTNNVILNNEIGIYLYTESDDNTISENKIINNTAYGIKLTFSKDNKITENDIAYNGDTGVFIEVSSNNNEIYHNNFDNNTQNAYDECSNTWDDCERSGGNYWSDYTGNDTDGDGIGSEPYNIPGGDNQDECPFMNRGGWLTTPDLDCDGTLVWNKVLPGAVETGSFTVRNVGEPGSKLDWNITEWPSWGTWTFTPMEGDDLTPENGLLTVQVSVMAPNEQNKQFSGNITITNRYDTNDYCTISVSLATPKNKAININPFFLRFLECYPSMFPLLRHLLGL